MRGNGAGGIYQWECRKGHTWTTAAHNVIHGTWCSQCNKLKMEDAIHEADIRGGKCLSTEYVNKREPMEWECSEGHRWMARLGGVRNNGKWCQKCSVDRKRLKLEDAQSHAIRKGGKCLSTEYVDLTTLMIWECEKGHLWNARFGHIRGKDTWCPSCRFKTETLCREIMEELFGFHFRFVKLRMECLEGLELDGYCADLGIAFEYDGRQHVEYIPHFHRNGISDLEEQQERDRRKDRLCVENSIDLLRIPHRYTYKKPRRLRNFIYSTLVEMGYGK